MFMFTVSVCEYLIKNTLEFYATAAAFEQTLMKMLAQIYWFLFPLNSRPKNPYRTDSPSIYLSNSSYHFIHFKFVE